MSLSFSGSKIILHNCKKINKQVTWSLTREPSTYSTRQRRVPPCTPANNTYLLQGPVKVSPLQISPAIGSRHVPKFSAGYGVTATDIADDPFTGAVKKRPAAFSQWNMDCPNVTSPPRISRAVIPHAKSVGVGRNTKSASGGVFSTPQAGEDLVAASGGAPYPDYGGGVWKAGAGARAREESQEQARSSKESSAAATDRLDHGGTTVVPSTPLARASADRHGIHGHTQQQSCQLRRFFSPDAVLPRAPPASLFVAASRHNSGTSDCGSYNCPGHGNHCRRRRRRPWSSGSTGHRDLEDTKMRGSHDRGGRRARTSEDEAGKAEAGVGAAIRGIRQRPHTVSTGLRDLGLRCLGRQSADRMCTRRLGRGKGRDGQEKGFPSDISMSCPSDGHFADFVGAGCGQARADLGQEGVCRKHSPTTSPSIKMDPATGYRPIVAAIDRVLSEDALTAPSTFRRRREELGKNNNDEQRDKSTIDLPHAWGAPRGRAVAGAMVGLTAEALGRSAVALDGSGRVTFVDQVGWVALQYLTLLSILHSPSKNVL